MRRLLSTSLSSRVLWRPRPVARACVGSRGLCSSGSDATLPALLEQHGLPAEAVPADADHEIVARNLRLLKALNVPDVPAAVSLEPELMSRDLVAHAPPRIEYLTSLGVSSIGDMVRHHPRLLWCDITRDLHRKVAILQALGVRKIAWWLQKNSRVLAVDVERDMRPPIELLRTVPGLDVGKVLNALPMGVFGKEPKLRKRIAYFADELALNPPSRIGSMISRWPHVLTYSIESNIQPKVEWLRSVGFSDVGELLSRNPRLLSVSLDALQEKHAFLTSEWGQTLEQLARFPQAYTYSLSYLRTRHGYLKVAGREGRWHLHRALRTADYLFAKKLAGRDVLEYQAYARAVVNGRAEASPDEMPDVDPGELELAEEVSAGLKNMKRRLEQTGRDEALHASVEETRQAVAQFLHTELGAPSGDASGSSAVEPTSGRGVPPDSPQWPPHHMMRKPHEIELEKRAREAAEAAEVAEVAEATPTAENGTTGSSAAASAAADGSSTQSAPATP